MRFASARMTNATAAARIAPSRNLAVRLFALPAMFSSPLNLLNFRPLGLPVAPHEFQHRRSFGASSDYGPVHNAPDFIILCETHRSSFVCYAAKKQRPLQTGFNVGHGNGAIETSCRCQARTCKVQAWFLSRIR